MGGGFGGVGWGRGEAGVGVPGFVGGVEGEGLHEWQGGAFAADLRS